MSGHRLLALIVSIQFVICHGPVSADFDSHEWRRFRDVQVPEQIPDGPVGIALESAVIENCRPDLADVRIVSSSGTLAPPFITSATVSQDPELIPAKVFKVVRSPGKWTDIWIDKAGKVLTRGVLLQTSSKDFVRKVELRGSDSVRESYVVRMDGLIADIASPIPLRTLDLFHPLNSFQYMHIRILDQENAPLSVEGVLCYPPATETGLSRPLAVRILENRTLSRGVATSMIVDLGERRFPLTELAVTTPTQEFTKKVTLFAASSPNPPSWNKIFQGTFFRLRREEVTKENLSVRLNPEPFRYVMIELSGHGGPAVTLDGVKARGTFQMAIFDYRRGGTYRLYYDNPKAEAAGSDPLPSSIDVRQLAELSKGTGLGAEQKNAAPSLSPQRKQPERQMVSGIWRIVGVLVLLVGLVLLFSLMLRARSLRRMERHGKAGLLDERRHWG